MRILQAVGLAAGTSLFFAIPLLAGEKKIQRSELPPAVEKTVAAQSLALPFKAFQKKGRTGRPSTRPK